MASSIGSLPTPNGALGPRIRLDIEELAAAVDLVSTPTFASTGARDTAYAAAIAAGKVGMSCYITNRAGVCRYMHGNNSTKGWRWEPQRNTLIDAHRSAAADAAGTSIVSINLMPAVTLPPGNRRVLIRAHTVAEALTAGGGTPRMYVTGPGIATYEDMVQGSLPAIGVQCTLFREWDVVASGSVSWNQYGINAAPGANVRFLGSILQVIDCGPSDD